MATPFSFNALLQTDNLSPVPQAGDYYHFRFRLLSACTTSKGTWRSTTFPEAVLKASMPLLEGVQARLDHNMWDVNDCVGNIVNVAWENAFVDKAGNTIPAGIVGEYQIDGKLYPDLVRKLTGVPDATPPILPIRIGSSVTVEFKFEPSHEFEDDWDFERNLGKTINGEEVTRVVTEIVRYYESSLVTAGADPYAVQRFSNLMPSEDLGNRMSLSFSKEPPIVQAVFEKEKMFVLNMDEQYAPKAPSPTGQKGNSNTPSPQEAQLKQQLEGLNTRFAELQRAHTESLQTAATLERQNGEAKRKIEQLEATIQQLEPQATLGKLRQEEIRLDTLKYARLALNTEVADAMESLIAAAQYESLLALHQQYKTLAEQKHPATCQECGGSVTRQSSTQNQTQEDPQDEQNPLSKVKENFHKKM